MTIRKNIDDNPAEKRSRFASFEKFFQHIPNSLLEGISFVFVEVLLLLLVLELIAQAFLGKYLYAIALPVLGICAEGTAFLWIGKKLFSTGQDRGRKYMLTLCDAALAIMLGWSVLSTVLSPAPTACLYGSSYRQEGLVTYFIYASFFICCRLICREKYVKKILWTFSAVTAVLALFSLICASPLGCWGMDQLGLGQDAAEVMSSNSIFSNPNHFSYLLTMGVMTAAGMFLLSSSIKAQILAALLYCINTAMQVKNGTLGGYLATALAIVFLEAIMFEQKDISLRKKLALPIAFALITVVMKNVGSDVAADVQTAVSDLQNISETTSSNTIRISMWREAISYIWERPIFGFGPDGSNLIVFQDLSGINDRPHNEYLQYAVYLGIPGAIFYLTALVGLFVRCIKGLPTLPVIGKVLGAAIFSYCVSAFVGNTMYYTTVYYFCLLGLLAGTSVKIDLQKERE